RGTAVDVALRSGTWHEHEVYLCGSDDMVRGSLERLRQAGVPDERIRYESFHFHNTPADLGG
ncbi:MAG TPA: oxidoreductase, partial [Micromonosporaceae bacterium]